MAKQMQTEELDYALKDDNLAVGLNAGSQMSEKIGIDGYKIKPCVAIYFIHGITQGLSSIGREPACHVIASELRRLGVTAGDAERLLLQWNLRNQPPIKEHDVSRSVQKLYGRAQNYNYSCDHFFISANCIGRTDCPYYKKEPTAKGKRKSLEEIFKSKGWMWVLRDGAKMIYLTIIPHFEHYRAGGHGRRIFANFREMAAVLGWANHSRVGKYLAELKHHGLISYVPGDPYRKNCKASEITRVLPIPDVPYHLRCKIKSCSSI